MRVYILIILSVFFLNPCSAQDRVKLVISSQLKLDSLAITINNTEDIEFYFIPGVTNEFSKESVRKFNSILKFLNPNLKRIFIANFPGNILDKSLNRFDSIKSVEFYRCENLEKIPIFNTSNLKSIDFSDCPKLDLKYFFSTIKSVDNCNIGFLRCQLLEIPKEILEVQSIKSLQIVSNGVPLIVPLKLFIYSNISLFNYGGTEILLKTNRRDIIEHLDTKMTILEK